MSNENAEGLPNPDNPDELQHAIAGVENALPSSKEEANQFLEKTGPQEKVVPKSGEDKRMLINRRYGPHMQMMNPEVRTYKPDEIRPVPFPKEYDFFYNSDYSLTSSDNLIQKESKDKEPANVSIGFIKRIAQSDKEDLKKVEAEFEKQHPEWLQQKALLTEAIHYFDSHEEDSVDVSIQTKDDGSVQSVTTGKVEGYKYRAFERKNLTADKWEGFGFEKRGDYLDTIDETITNMEAESPIKASDKELVLEYLEEKIMRYDTKVYYDEDEAYKGNLDLVNALRDKVKNYNQVIDDVALDEAEINVLLDENEDYS